MMGITLKSVQDGGYGTPTPLHGWSYVMVTIVGLCFIILVVGPLLQMFFGKNEWDEQENPIYGCKCGNSNAELCSVHNLKGG